MSLVLGWPPMGSSRLDQVTLAFKFNFDFLIWFNHQKTSAHDQAASAQFLLFQSGASRW